MIPVYKPSITDLEKKYINDCINSTWISSKGEYIEKFEHEFSKKIGIKYCTTVSNGTLALHLALMGIGISEGDEVIVPTLTYIASVNSIKYVGATPIFADSLLDSWQIDPLDIERKITKKTKAIMVVHLYGQACDMDTIMDIAKKNNLFVIEDCAESFGTTYKNKHVGTFGDVATFSFFGNKTITTGEGGMVVSNNKNIIDKCFHIKSQGLAGSKQYWHDIVGYNYRLTNLACAIGVAQLERSDEILSSKRIIANFYNEKFENSNFLFHKEIVNTKHSYWMCSIIVPDNFDRDSVMEYLKNKNIETRPVFYQAHTMPMYKTEQFLPVANLISSRGINLPSYPDLSIDEINYITKCVLEYDV